MEKEMNEKKKTKSITKKAKKIRSIVMMSLLCVLMLSAATYAWFTLSKTAKVTNLTMTVGDVTGLQISEDGNAWSGELPLDAISAKLMPSTCVYKDSAWSFYEPEYNDAGKITGISKLTGDNGKITDDTKDKKYGYYYEKTFYMKSLGENANVYLAKGTDLDSGRVKGDSSEVSGTYIEIDGVASATDTQALAPAAIRVSFQVGTYNPVAYAPFDDVTMKGTSAAYADASVYSISTNATTRPTIVASQNTTGTYNNGTDAATADKSKVLFTLAKDTKTAVTMRVWVEGDDEQCVNEIQLETLIGQLVFESETVTN